MKKKTAKKKPATKKRKTPTHIGDLVPDPANARRHSPRNIGAIVSSLGEVGAARSIVIDENDVILAGNGLVEAAGEAGIEKVMVVEADGDTVVAVRRRGLTPKQKAVLAIADNRANELSEFDPEQLIKTAGEHGIDLKDLAFTEAEISRLADKPLEDTGAQTIDEKFEVVIECSGEAQQREVFERMTREGYTCKVLTI